MFLFAASNWIKKRLNRSAVTSSLTFQLISLQVLHPTFYLSITDTGRVGKRKRKRRRERYRRKRERGGGEREGEKEREQEKERERELESHQRVKLI